MPQPTAPKQSTKTGFGRYRGYKKKNGKYRVKDVEIFAEHKRRGKTFDSAWIDNAIHAAELRRTEQGYYPPLHIHHHYEGDEVKHAGHFIPTKRVERTYNGEATQILLADFDDVPADVYAQMKSGELPYRSVEIHDPSKAEIDSLALLSHHVPYFRFRNLRVDEEIPQDAPADFVPEVSYKKGEPVLTYAAEGAGLGLLFSFNDDATDGTTTIQEEGIEKYVGVPLASIQPNPGMPPLQPMVPMPIGAATTTPTPPGVTTETGLQPGQTPEEAQAAAAAAGAGAQDAGQATLPQQMPAPLPQMDPAAIMAETKAALAKTIIEALTSALGGLSSLDAPAAPLEGGKPDALAEGEDEDDKVPTRDAPPTDEEEDDRVTGGPVSMSAKKNKAYKATEIETNTSSAQTLTGTSAQAAAEAPGAPAQPTVLAALQGRLAALEARQDATEKKRTLGIEVETAERQLLRYGLNDEAKKELRDIAEREGAAGISSYVAAVKRYGVPDPDLTEDAEISTGTHADEAIQAYADKGPEVVQLACMAAAQYDSAPDSLKRTHTREAFIKSQILGLSTN